jgi:hypothetical protein
MEDLLKKIEEQDRKLDAIYLSVEKTRAYFKWSLILTAVFLVLPLVGIAFIAPFFLRTLNMAALGL